MASCKSSSSPKIEGVPGNLPDIPLYGSAATPPHSMSRGDYPFDSNGNYMTAWAAQGGSSSSAAIITGHSEEMPPEPAPGSKRRSSLAKVENAPPELKSSYTPKGGRKSEAEPPARKGGASKSTVAKTGDEGTPKTRKKPAAEPETSKTKKKTVADSDSPKPKKKTTTGGGGGSKYVVKSTDTLAGIAKKFGTTESKLKAANHLKSDLIIDGRSLTIPK